MFDANILIPILFTIHIIGIASGYITMEILMRKDIVAYKGIWKDMYVIGFCLWMFLGMLSPLFIWLTYKIYGSEKDA